MKLARFEVDSPFGPLHLFANDHELVSLRWRDPHPFALTPSSHPVLDEARAQLGAYFSGHLKKFDLPLAPAGTAFQKSVWRELMTIPYGSTVSYRDIAKSLQNERAVRAVGAANGRNPLCIFIPCHRVVGANGTLTGYAGGLEVKKKLLDFENRGTLNSDLIPRVLTKSC